MTTGQLRVVFMGSPDFAVPALRAISGAGYDIPAVYTQPPRPRGRGHRELATPVHLEAERLGLRVHHPRDFRQEEERDRFRALAADVAVVAAYGLILPEAILAAPRFGCLNIHASLLPRWRGAAPIQRAILAGDRETGISIMRMERGLDTGPVVSRRAVAIDALDAGQLHARLSDLGAEMILAALDTLALSGRLVARPQDPVEATYAAKISPDEAAIDWTQPAQDILRLIRAFAPRPGAWFVLPGTDEARGRGPDPGPGRRVKVLHAALAATGVSGAPGEVLDDGLCVACGAGALHLLEVQRAGRARMSAAEFLRGHVLPPGTRLPPVPLTGAERRPGAGS